MQILQMRQSLGAVDLEYETTIGNDEDFLNYKFWILELLEISRHFSVIAYG